MAVFSSKNNYICGASFTGESFLVLEFDNRKNKKTVRTKGEIGVGPFLDKDFNFTDKVMVVEAAKRIRKNTKSKSVYINKTYNGIDLTHFFEIFSVAGFEDIRFIDTKNILNNAFRKRMIHGQDCFLLIEGDRYYLYLSDEKGVELVATADSLDQMDLSKDAIKKALDGVLDSKIEVYGLKDYADFNEVEDKLFSFGYKAVVGNVWQNAFSVNDHIPSIHFEESSMYAMPVALALFSDIDQKSPTNNPANTKSIADDLKIDKEFGKKIVLDTLSENNNKKEEGLTISPDEVNLEKIETDLIKENIKSETSLKDSEAKVGNSKQEDVWKGFSTNINLPILSKDFWDKNIKPADCMATYVPDAEDVFTEHWESFEEGDLGEAIDNLNKAESGGEQDVVQNKQSDQEDTSENKVEGVVIEDMNQEERFDFEEMMEVEKEDVEEVEIEVVEGSKEIKKEVKAEEDVVIKKEKVRNNPKRKSKKFSFKNLFTSNKKQELSEKPKVKKKKKKKSKNSRKHKKNK